MKRKILFLYFSMPIGGAEAILINYLNIAAQHPDYQVELALLEPSEQYNMDKIDPKVKVHFILSEAEAQFLRYNHWKVKENSSDVGYHKGWLDHIVKDRRERLTKLIDEQQYDVVIDFLNCIGYHLGTEFISSINRPYIYWIHANSDFTRWKEKTDFYKLILSKYNIFVSICRDMEENCQKVLREDFNLSGKTVKTIFNPIDINRILRNYDDYLDEDSELINQPFILQVARLNEGQKNHSKLIELYAKLKAKGIEEKLYIIGDGPSRDTLEAKIRELGLEDDCLLLGKRLNPYPFMKKARLFVHTAFFEGLPTVFIESMICGTPVVAFDCPTGPREILDDGNYGELIPMGDDDLFVEKTYELLTNEDKRQAFIDKLPESYSRFTMRTIGRQFFELIDDTILFSKFDV